VRASRTGGLTFPVLPATVRAGAALREPASPIDFVRLGPAGSRCRPVS
jgi:hypothetical protein